MWPFIANTTELALEAAPWLLLGLVAAGLLKAWLPTRTIGRKLAGSGVREVGAAALIGAPLPLCSCGVLPAAFGMRRAGASKASTVSFLVSTPETGVDSIALSYALLGPFLAVFRPVAAVLSALTAGLLVGGLTRGEGGAAGSAAVAERGARPAVAACCRGGDGGGGCASERRRPDAAVEEATSSPWRRSLAGLRYAFTELLDDIAGWLAAGILVAGAVVTLVPPATLTAWAGGPLAMLLMLAVSVPMYVCATASTPLAHAMLYAGVSPGTVLVFLLAGPATNMAGLALVRRELGGRALAGYLAGVCGAAVALGLALDAAVGYLGFDVILAGLAGADQGLAEAELLPGWLALSSLVILGAFALRPVRRFAFERVGTARPLDAA